MPTLARIRNRTDRLRDWTIGIAASTFLIAGSATGTLPFSMTETLGFVTGALSVWLLVRESIWNWPAGIANGVFYLVLFAQARFFADSALQIVFIVLGAYGWWYWLRGRQGRASRPITRIGVREAAVLLVLTAGASYAMLLYLRSIGDAAPLADAVTTALSLAATWMQARKQIENWLVWIAADAIYIPLYFVKGLPLTGALYVVFAAMCVKGFRDWSRTRSAEAGRRWARGAVVGKFLPFHSGHRYPDRDRARAGGRRDGDRRRPRLRADPGRAAQALDRGGAAGRDGRSTRSGRGRPRERRQRRLGDADDPRCSGARPTSSSPRSVTGSGGRRPWAAST